MNEQSYFEQFSGEPIKYPPLPFGIFTVEDDFATYELRHNMSGIDEQITLPRGVYYIVSNGKHIWKLSSPEPLSDNKENTLE